MAKKRVEEIPIPGAVLYSRVSSVGQARDGVSLEAQEASCRALAERRDWGVLASHRDEGISGQKDETRRPGLASVIAATQSHPGAVVVVYSLSRLSRSQRTTWRLLDDRGDHRLRVCSVTEPWDMSSPMGRAMLGMLAVWNQLEADLAGERTKAALEHVRAQGKPLGAPGMLERVDEETGLRVVDAGKADIIRAVQALKLRSGLSLRALAAELERQGIASVNGARWHPRTLRKALALEL